MPLAWNEIRSRAVAFSKKWESEESERAEAQSFWNDFFNVFGIERRRVAVFEKSVDLVRPDDPLHSAKLGRTKRGRIDAFWKGVLLIEHKSADQDLNRAFTQATDYFDGIAERDLPRYILVSDFKRFQLYDLEAEAGKGDEIHFKLAEFSKHIKRFGFIAGYQAVDIKPQDPVNIKAAEKMGRLHDALKASGYEGHPLEVLLVRLLFCLFADDTGIFFSAQVFRSYLEERTRDDGSDLGAQLAQLFQVLNTPDDKRAKTLDELFKSFPYVNGKLFEETLPMASFDSKMRDALLDCCKIDWATISPAIFGALFQSIMDSAARRNLGAHYTSEENILKLIKPLFLDELWAEFEKLKNNKSKLFEFHKKLRALTFFDPACGCGNFLVITYRELRLLELAILRVVHDTTGTRFLDVHQEIKLDVDQFYGIEIEEFPAQIAQVAMWLIDHQMNVKVGDEFGMYFARIPLKTSPHIVHGNALRIDWATVLPPAQCSYVMGNPPFIGKHYRSDTQRLDMAVVFGKSPGVADLDYVASWYKKALDYMTATTISAAFVSTSSITQGEQSPFFASLLAQYGASINFAHQAFRWSNEAKGQAGVHCVVIGFALQARDKKILYVYETAAATPMITYVASIGPSLRDEPTNFVIKKSTAGITPRPQMGCGSKASDGGFLILNAQERKALVQASPEVRPFVREYVGSEEFINGGKRWCLWLVDADPKLIRSVPEIYHRVQAVKQFRNNSSALPTKNAASTPAVFFYINQPKSDYLFVPEVSSERRTYVPIGRLSKNVVASNKGYLVAPADDFLLGLLQSEMHMAWMRRTAGRLESRFQYSASMVYNTFPWPENPSDTQKQKIEAAAQGVLDARAKFPDSSLADLYDPLTMPPALVKAHQKLDAAVDAAYGRKSFKSDAERVAFLFELYQKYTSILPIEAAKKPVRRKKSAA